MTSEKNDLLAFLRESIAELDFIAPEDIPDIDLYMDQVTTFMDTHLQHSRRRDGDKILTKTMINNYAKNKLLPTPEKKKYSREHILFLIMIYYYKGFLSLQDIQTLLQPVIGHYYKQDGDALGVADLYARQQELSRLQMEDLTNSLEDLSAAAASAFPEAEGQEQEFLQVFTLINLLAFDVYVRKQLIEKLIDRCLSDPKTAGKAAVKNAAKTAAKEKDNRKDAK